MRKARSHCAKLHPMTSVKGCLDIIGTGIRLAGQLTAESRSIIVSADRVLAVAADAFCLSHLCSLNSRVTSLTHHYSVGRQRDRTYERMVETILEPVRHGERVCAVFYGHPGVFVWPSHEAVRRARAEGFPATMYPAVSSEDCLYADLGLDPARSGCQSYECMDFLLYGRVFDPTAALILWQPAALGDISRSTFETDPAWVAALAEVLIEKYPPGHEIIVYEAASFPLDDPRVEPVALNRLREVSFTQASTLYVPPLKAPALSRERLEKLGVTEDRIAVANFQKDR